MSFNPERRLWRRHIPPLGKVCDGPHEVEVERESDGGQTRVFTPVPRRERRKRARIGARAVRAARRAG